MKLGRRLWSRRGAAAAVTVACAAAVAVPLVAQAVVYPSITATIAVDANPLTVALNPSTGKLYVSASGANVVDVVNTANNQIVKRVTTPSLPYGLAVDSSANKVYVASGNAGTVTVIDGASDTVQATIPVGGGPNFVAVDALNHRAFTSNTAASTVTVIDTTTNLVAGTLTTTGTLPQGIALNPTAGTIYVASRASNDDVSGTVDVFDRTTLAPVTSFAVGGSPQTIAVDAPANRAYVVNGASGTVSVVDGATNTVTGLPIPVGASPVGAAVNPAMHRLYVTNFLGNSVSLINTTTGTVDKTITGTASPFGVEIVAPNQAYVADNQSSTLSVITEFVDTTPPHTTITSRPPALTASRSATFTFTATDDHAPPAGIHSECALDGAPFAACTSPITYTGLADLGHTFAVRSIDESGNVESPVSASWTVDGSPPDTSFLSVPPNPANNVHAFFTFTGTDNVTASNALTFQCQVDNQGYGSCRQPVLVNTGFHTYQVRAIDQMGNVDPTPASYTWQVVDNDKPRSVFSPDNGSSYINTTNLLVLTPLRGYAFDDVAGIDHIDVTFVRQPGLLSDTLPGKIITERLDPGHGIACDDASNTSCRWEAAPSVLPGTYKVYLTATDRSNPNKVESPGPDPITIDVL